MDERFSILRAQLPEEHQSAFDAGLAAAVAGGWAEWIVSYQDAYAVSEGCYFDTEAGQHAVDFISLLRHSKGKWRGQRIRLMVWQVVFVMTLFGWMRADGTRRFRKCYLEVPKKNGKSTLAAAIELYLLVMDGEGAPEVYCAAKDRFQASIVFGEASRMVRSCPALAKRLKVIKSTKSITFEASDGILRALSADAGSNEGLNISGLVIDELHVHKNRDMFDALWYGGDARRQPLMVIITTAGEYDEDSIGWEMHSYAKNVIDGTFTDTEFYATIYGIDKDDDWTDPAVWAKANPSLGETMSYESLASAVREATNAPSKIPTLLRYRFDVWVQAANAWMDKRAWLKCQDAFPLENLAGRRCYGGLDLSSNKDTTSLQLVFIPTEDDPVYRVRGWYWLPKDELSDRARENQATYGVWAADGWMETMSGAVVDLAFVERRINELAEKYDIQEIGYDPWRAQDVVGRLSDAGHVMVEMRQGPATLSDPMNALERLILSQGIRHDGNPVTTWQCGNLIARSDVNGNIAPDKRSTRKKIDGWSAMINAMGRALAHREEDETAEIILL